MGLLKMAKSAGSLLVGGVQLAGKATYEGSKYAYKEAKRLKAEKQPEINEFQKELDNARKNLNVDIAKATLVGARALQELSEEVAKIGIKRIEANK